MPQSHPLNLTQNVLNAKQRKHQLISWLCSTTFIVSPVLADAFDFRVEQDALGQVLHVERFEHKHLRPDSPERSPRNGSFRLNDYPIHSQIEHEGLTLKLDKDGTGTKIRVNLFKGRESLGYLDIKDDGTVHVTTQATSDHLFITSTKDIYVEGHTSKGMHDCNLTLQTDANVYLKGVIVVQNLFVVANRIISTDVETEIVADRLSFKAKHLETAGKYRCSFLDIDVENEWENKADFEISDCVTVVNLHTLRNRRRINARRLVVHALQHFDNSNSVDGDSFIVHEQVSLSGLISFQNKGRMRFEQGINIHAADSISVGTMSVLTGDVRLSATRIDIEALANNGKGVIVDIIADHLNSKQIIALSCKVILNVSQKATLDGMHSAHVFTFEGGEVEHKGHLEAQDALEFMELKKFTHASGEIVAHEVKGIVTHFQNDGLINVSKLLQLKGEELNNTGVICGRKTVVDQDLMLKFNYAILNNSGHILAITDDITNDDVKAKLGAIKKREDLQGLTSGKILMGTPQKGRVNRVNNTGRIVAGKMYSGGSFFNDTSAAVFIYDSVFICNSEYITSPGVLDVGLLVVLDKELDNLTTVTDPLTINGNIQTQRLLVKLNRAVTLQGKLVVLDESENLISAESIKLEGDLAWIGQLKVKANTVEIANTSKFQFAPTQSVDSTLDIVLDTSLLTNHGKVVVSTLTLVTPEMIVDNHGTIQAAIHAPVVLRELLNQKDAVISVHNAAELNIKERFYSYGTLEFKESIVLKVCEGEKAAKNAEGVWNANVWFVETVLARKNLTLHTPVFAFLGTSKIDGTLNITADVGFFKAGEHSVGSLSGSVAQYLLIHRGAVVRVKRDLELERGKLIDAGILTAKAITVKDGRLDSTGKLHATTLAVALSKKAVPMVTIVERVEEDGNDYRSPKQEVSVTTTEMPATDVAAYKAQKQKEIKDYSNPSRQSIRFEKKRIDSEMGEITEYVEEPGTYLQRSKVLSTATKRMNFQEYLTYETQRRADIAEINTALRNRKKRTITFTEHKVLDVILAGDTEVKTATINVPCIDMKKAKFDQGTLTGHKVVLGSNTVGSLTVSADTAKILANSVLGIGDVDFSVARSMTAGSGSTIRGIGTATAAARKIAVTLSSGASIVNQGHFVGETVAIGGTAGTLRGNVENSGRIHADALFLSNLAAFRNVGAAAEVQADAAHLNGVRIESKTGKVAFKRLAAFNDISADTLIIIDEPYTAKPSEDLSRFKFLSTLTIDAGRGDYTLQNVTAKHIKINGANIKIGAGVHTECLEISSTNMVFFESGVTVDQIGQIVVHSGNVTIRGNVNVAQFTAKFDRFVVELGSSLICGHLNLTGVNALSSLLSNNGKITTTKLFTTNTLRIENAATGTITMQHSFTKDSTVTVPNFIINNGTIDVKGDVTLARVGYSGAKGTFNASGKFSLIYGDKETLQLGNIHADTINISATTGIVNGGFKAKQVLITASEIHVTQETTVAEKIKLNMSRLHVSARISCPELEIVGATAGSTVSVTATGSITTDKNIVWGNIQTLENLGEIKTKADLVLINIAKIVQNGVLASENNVIIGGESTTELTSDMHSDKKAIFGKTVTIGCKLVQGVKVIAAGSVVITAANTLEVELVESGGSISLNSAKKISVCRLKASGGITFSAAQLIHLGPSIEADGDILIPAGGELSLHHLTLISKRSIVIKRKLKSGHVNAVISGHVVEWDLTGLNQLEQNDFLNGGKYQEVEKLQIKAVDMFRLILPHPVCLTTLPNFLKDSNLEFRTSSFVSSHGIEYPHSLTLTGLTTSHFNEGKPIKIKGRLYTWSSVDQEITGIVDTGKGWIFNKAVKVRPGAQLSALSGNCSADDLFIDQANVLAGNLAVANGVRCAEGHLQVNGNLTARDVSNLYSGNFSCSAAFDRTSWIRVSGNATVTNSFKNEWLNPTDEWHDNEATFIDVGGTLTVGTAGGRSATFLNKCGRVYVNGKINFNGQKFENLSILYKLIRVLDKSGRVTSSSIQLEGGSRVTPLAGGRIEVLDQSIHANNTSVIGRGGIFVNDSEVKDNSSNTTSFVNQGMLSGEKLTARAYTATTTVSSGDETPLTLAKGAMSLTPAGVKFDLPEYMPPTIAGAAATHTGPVIIIVGIFSAMNVKAGRTSGVVDLDDNGVEISDPKVSSEEIARLDQDDFFYGLLDQPSNTLDVWLKLQIDPATQAILKTFATRLYPVIGDFSGGLMQISHSFLVEYKLFQQLAMSCCVNILDSEDFDTREAFYKATHAFTKYLSLYGDISSLPIELRKYIKLEPRREAAMAYAVRRDAMAPATQEQAAAFISEMKDIVTSDNQPYGIGATERDVEEVANKLQRIVIVYEPVTLLDGTVKHIPQLYLPQRYQARVTAPIASIQADVVDIAAEDVMKANGVIPAAKTLRLTAHNHLELSGEITAGQAVYLTVEQGDLDIGPYWDSSKWRASVVGGKELTVIVAKRGYVNIYPGSIFDGKEIIIQCWARLYLSPSVSVEWKSKTESCGWFGCNTKTTRYQEPHYVETITLLNAASATTLESTGSDVDVSGLHLVQTVFGEALRGPITALAAGNVVADALVTPLSSTAVSRFLGIVSYNTEKKHEEALKVTRLHSMPNLVTLEKVLNNPEVMGALLAEMLGVATEAHKKTLEDDPDVAELKRATVRLKAKGMVRGKGASLAGAFAELVAGESIAMNEAISESTTHTSGWTPDFGVIGRAISAIINDCCNDTKDAIAAKAPSAEEEAKKIMAEHMGGVMSVLVDVVQDMMKQRFDSAVKELTEKKKSEPTKDEVIEALKAAATPLIDMLSLNAVSLGTAISEFCTMVNSQHDYKWIGASVGAANVVMQACKMADLIEAVCVNGLEKVWEKGLESLENMISIGISFYDSHVTRKTPHKGSIQALFGLKMRADTLLLNGSDANAMVMDLNAHRVEVGAVCYESDSKETSGGVSLSLGKTLSVHGEWATHKRRTYVPTRQTAQFMRFGTPGHPVDELVIYGSQLKGVMGTGTIRKLTLVDKADTHAQDGASWNASVSLKDLGQTGWDAVSSVGFGVKGGDSSKVVDGKAEFKCDGVEVLAIERITAETYDRRYGVNLTKHFTSTGDAAGAAAAYAPGYSGRLELGEDSVGFELPNVMFHEKTETTSQQITRRDAEQAALEAQRQREAAQRAADAAEELQRNALKAICDQFEAENPTLVKDLIAKEAAEAEAKRAAEAQRQRDLAAQRAAAAAKDTELQKEKINEALVNMLTPGQLAQNVADAEYKKTSAYQIEQELQHIKARTQEMQKMSAAEKNTPEWRKEFMDLHQASERLGVFDPEWRERQATAGAAGMVGTLAVLAPQFTYRMMLGHFAGKAMTEGLLQNAHSEEDVAMAHLVGLATDLAVGSHMPVGGLVARGVPLTTAAAAATAESGGLLNRLRAAGQEFGQWRPDPHAMGSGGLPLTRKAPPAIATPLEIATAGEARAAASVAPVAEAAVNGAPVRLKTAVKGEMAEAAGRRALDYARGDHLPTRLPGNRGIDDARVFYDPAGKINGIDIVVDIVITESKFATGGGFPKLARTTDGVQQLSPAWMKKQIDALEHAHPESYKILKANQDKIRFKANVQDEFGVNRWYDYGRYNPSNFKEFNAIRTPKITGGE